MSRPLPFRNWGETNITVRYLSMSGEQRVCGGKNLKATQAYTREFGEATVELWENDETEVADAKERPMPELWGNLTGRALWQDAKVAEVMQFLTV
jgi:hypothetical protein